MNRTSIALAASLMFTPAMAASKCDDIKEPHDYKNMTVHEEADVPNHKFCISFTTDDPQIKEVEPTPVKPGCIDVEGDKTQGVTPVIISTIGIAYIMETLGFEQAKDEFNSLVEICEGPKTSINFPVIPGTTFKRLEP